MSDLMKTPTIGIDRGASFKEVQLISEIDAIGFGGSALAQYSDCIVVSIGTGTAIVHFSKHGGRDSAPGR